MTCSADNHVITQNVYVSLRNRASHFDCCITIRFYMVLFRRRRVPYTYPGGKRLRPTLPCDDCFCPDAAQRLQGILGTPQKAALNSGRIYNGIKTGRQGLCANFCDLFRTTVKCIPTAKNRVERHHTVLPSMLSAELDDAHPGLSGEPSTRLLRKRISATIRGAQDP